VHDKRPKKANSPFFSLPRKFLQANLFCTLLTFFPAGNALGAEVDGDLSLQGRLFLHDGASSSQQDASASVATNLELYHEVTTDFSLTLAAFYRLDSSDNDRTHADLREANLLYLADNWQLRVGFGRVFWGATEFVHLVDIINQTDLVEALDGEEKLGQPMAHLVIAEDWGSVEGFVMPWFRERTFPGDKGRFRSPLAVDTDHPLYESSSEEQHLDLALRYNTSLANGDIGLYYFNGTARDPVLLFSFDPAGAPLLSPYYEQIGQSGLDLQLVAGEWLFKGEALYRIGQSHSFAATTFGFEYTFPGLGDSLMDLGLIGEYVYDDRDQEWLPTIYDNDLMAGLRLSLNDIADSTILLGVIQDLDTSAIIIGLEASRRLGDNIRLNLDASFFLNISSQDPAYSLAADDFLLLEMIWYF